MHIKITQYIFMGIFLSFGLTACKQNTALSPAEKLAIENRLIDGLRAGNEALVDSCLQFDIDVNIKDEEGNPLILLAIGKESLVRKLLEKGADVNAPREKFFQSTALMELAGSNDTLTAKLLLERGANVNQLDSMGDPAVNWVAYYGHVPYMKLLVDYGARLDIESKHGAALDIAMKQWNDDLVDFLIQKGVGQPIENEVAKAMIIAVKKGEIGEVRALLKKGGDTNQKDEAGTPLLLLAASKGDLDMLNYLLRKGANIDEMNRVGQTALSRAAHFGHSEIVERLIKKGANVNLAGQKYNLTPLISAAVGGRTIIGQQLIDASAEVNAQDGLTGFTPLMYATAYGHVAFVKLLLEAKASPYIKAFDGSGLYDMLSFSTNREIANLLEEYILNE